MATGRPFDMVVFGASGFTGQYVIQEVAKAAAEEEEARGSLRWAVAGRSQEKLQAVLEKSAAKLGKPELKSEVGIILCDVSDPASLANMAKQTAIVLNCVGPYRFFGEAMVKACVENGTSCIDISGEPQFLEGMYLKYNDQAAEKGIYIVGSCGFDSIPADMGVLYTKNNLKGTLTAVESFFSIKSGPEGVSLHDGTWKSAIYGLADQENLKKIRRQIGHKPIPVIGAKLQRRGAVFFCNELQQYSIIFMGSDFTVVKRTQQYMHTQEEETPVQYAAYATVGGIGSVLKLMFAGLLFLMLVKFNCGRKLLIKYPEFFSGGYFTKDGPTEKQMEKVSFVMTFFGEGYSTGKDPHQGKPDVKICTQVKGPEPGYVATPIAMVQAGMTLLKDKSSLPKKGGVYTPGAAFSKTKLIDRLNKHGVEFSVISKPEV
ncbi:saccharopine dehydrogenase-like oxidoreductase [Anolis carolinensis]|uniref:Saccharopine dehydrogenase-like oxidoreductase n=1 Tax=Anolis carolinensis TaxID=28377 RepID=G1K8G2_ANOCA|nr:PREDICTED: saccharopine dehydrogenase-like oxidoreductase [Anolis carolinensis]|eukprot:XP_003215989.1 PREDICTED: saccharopine dehydrogenase-like oxidoreductase [Anolis carolinensis]